MLAGRALEGTGQPRHPDRSREQHCEASMRAWMSSEQDWPHGDPTA